MPWWARQQPVKRYETLADVPLLQAVVDQEAGAWEALVSRYGHLVYTLCAYVFVGQELEAACLRLLARLREDHCALLRAFHGRATLTTYLTLTISNLLALDIQALFTQDADRAWRAFEQFFRQDILHVIRTVFAQEATTLSAGQSPDDRYQDICLLLIAQDYHRIKAYDGRGAFAAYIRSIVRRLCVDLLRHEHGRRRLPAKMVHAPAVEQAVFQEVYWDGQAVDEGQRRLMAHGYTSAQAAQALAHMQQVAGSGLELAPRRRLVALSDSAEMLTRLPADAACGQGDPEATLLDAEAAQQQQELLQVLQEALHQLPEEAQRYVRLRYGSTPEMPPREIARQLECPIEEVYRLRQQTFAWLKARLHTWHP